MGYDYSLRYLSNHAELVSEIVKVATSGELLAYESTDFNTISNRQRLVSNLLASISRNVSGMEDIRDKVRCWTDYGEGEDGSKIYKLFVGVPEHNVTGRRPGVKAKRNLWMDKFIPASTVDRSIYVHRTMIDSQETLEAFTGAILSLSPVFKKASVRVMDLTDEAIVDYFGPVFQELGWTASRDGINLLLERA